MANSNAGFYNASNALANSSSAGENPLAPTLANTLTNNNNQTTPAYADGTDSAPAQVNPASVNPAVANPTSNYAPGQPNGAQTPQPMVSADSVDSSQLDPAMAQVLLSKVAAGQPLQPQEKLAASKLPPSVLAHAALAGTSPLPDNPKMYNLPSAPAPQIKPINQISAGYIGKDVEGSKGMHWDPPANAAGAAAPQPATDASSGLVTNNGTGSAAGLPSGNTPGPGLSSVTPGDVTGANALAHSGGGPNTPPYGMGNTVSGYYQGNPLASAVKPINQSTQPVVNTMPPDAISGASPVPIQSVPSPNVIAAQKTLDSPATPPSLKNLQGADIAKMIGNILDVVGVGLSARGGVQRQTMLQHQMQLQQQAQTNLAQKQGEANIDINKATTLLPVEAQNEIAIARGKGDIDTENAIRLKNGIAPIDLSNQKNLAEYENSLDINGKKNLYSWMLLHGIQVPGSTVPLGLINNASQAGANYVSQGMLGSGAQ